MRFFNILYLLLVSYLSNATPNIEIKHLIVHQFDDKGQLVQILKSKKVRQTKTDLYHLIQPFVQIKQSVHEIPIQITANEGNVYRKDQQIDLQHKVIIKQEGELSTEKIVFYPQKKLAETNNAILIQRPNGDKVTAIGMIALLEQQQIDLLHNIKAIIHPTKDPMIQAFADKMHYNGRKSQADLIGHAKVKQKNNIFQAPSIHYDVRKQKIETPAIKNQQTEIVFQSE